MINSLKGTLHREGEGLEMWQTGRLKIFLLHLGGASKAGEQRLLQQLGWAGKALGQVWRCSLAWQHAGCSPARLMTEVVTGSSSQALEGVRLLLDPPLTQQHTSSYSFAPV